MKFDPIIEKRLMDFLHQNFGFEVFTPGLERTGPLYKNLVSLYKKAGTKIITIAGTNGKGQTAHTIAHLLKLQDCSVALWTSPHILSICERFNFGENVSYDELEREMLLAHKVANGVSFYEFLFFVFLRIGLKREKIDYLVLEVGLGGRLDAVNHFDTDCAAITSISRDHQQILGNSLKEILLEKIAVSRKGKPLFTSFSLDYLNELTAIYCQSHHVDLITLPAEADYYQSNIQMARAIVHFFLPSAFPTLKSDMLTFKGRHELMTFKRNTLIFIGAHNVEGMRKMLEHFSIKKSFNSLDVVMFSFSKRAQAEIEVMLQMLAHFSLKNIELWPTSFNHPKAVDREVIEKESSKFINDWRIQLEKYSSANENKTILVCGSYYFIGEVQRFILDC